MKSLLPGILILFSLFGANAQNTASLSKEFTEGEILKTSRILHNEAVLDSLLEQVVSNSNLVKALDEEIKMYDEEILQKKRSWISSFRMGVNMFSASTALDPNNESVTTYGLLPNVGLNLTIDPEKLVNRKSYVRQSTNKREYSRYIQENSKQVLKKDILNLYYDYLSALEAANLRLHALQAREEQLEFLQASFKNGEVSYDQLLIIENQVHLAREAHMEASVNAMKRKSEISVLIGLR